ncbi:MAG: hypothetical protein CL488_05945 [Acidobacteria bacterium]|nr:hypothetical protein [Acidobacteriota bacterium]
MTSELCLRTIAELAPQVKKGAISALELTDACLEQITKREADLNAFIAVDRDGARATANRADDEIAAGQYRGPLHGIPISVKDMVAVAGLPTTAASRVRPTTPAQHDATIVANLKAAGAVVLGKCNLHEFAFGTTGEDSAFGPTRNPHDTSRSPGGSSGGSAAAVAAGMSYGSIGTDTGGSIRIPSAACGVVGLKPGFGELSCDGVLPLSRSLDHVGPLARSVVDVWLLYRAMGGEQTTVPLKGTTRKKLRLGVPRRHFMDHLDPHVRDHFNDALDRLGNAGVDLSDVDVPHAGEIAAVYLHIVLPEGMTYHSKTLNSRPEDYTPGVRRRLEMGHYILAEDYLRAQRGREMLRREVTEALSVHDALILPTLAIPAPPYGIESVTVDGLTESVRNLTLRLTQVFNLTGHPAISIPSGNTPTGLPCGLQLVGHTNQTVNLLTAARYVEETIR